MRAVPLLVALAALHAFGACTIRPVLPEGGEVGPVPNPTPREPSPDRYPGGEQTQEDAVRTELSEVASAQQAYRRVHGTYASTVGRLEEVDYEPRAGISVRIIDAMDSGFSAVASRGGTECALFVGTAAPPRSYVRNRGAVECETSASRRAMSNPVF